MLFVTRNGGNSRSGFPHFCSENLYTKTDSKWWESKKKEGPSGFCAFAGGEAQNPDRDPIKTDGLLHARAGSAVHALEHRDAIFHRRVVLAETSPPAPETITDS